MPDNQLDLRQPRLIGIGVAIAVLLASAFPPFQITISNRTVGLGFSFLFSPPGYNGSSLLIGTVDIGTLLAEYVGIIAVGALAWLVAQSMPATPTSGETPQDQPAKMKWGRLKKGAATGLVIVIAMVTIGLSKGLVRALFHHPNKPAAEVGGNAFDKIEDTHPAPGTPAGRFIDFDKAPSTFVDLSRETSALLPRSEPPKVVAPDERRVLILQRELSDRVPGWMKIRDSAEFKEWLPKQSAEIKAAADSWDVSASAGVFAAFDKHKSDAADRTAHPTAR